jgi:hypothetical protein
MIATLETPRAADAAARPARPLIVELAGPAAVGKTAVIHALGAGDRRLRAGLRVPRRRHVATAFALAPTFLALHRPYPGLLWKEMKRITWLGTLHRLLRERRAAPGDAILLDEGAVYMLARLEVHGAGRIRSDAYARWRQEAIDTWAAMLDLVVWLDAPDSVLRERLRRREQPHPVKHLPDGDIDRFLSSYREAYRRVIHALAEADGPRVVAVRTDREDAEHVAGRVTAELRDLEYMES